MAMTETVERPFENAYVVPGTRLVAGEYPALPDAGSEEKLGRVLDAGVTTFVDLTAPEDRMRPYEATLRALAGRRGLDVDVRRMPIRDMDVCEPAHMRRVLDAIDGALAAGRAVYVHCWGGVGRTGTVVGCHLVRHGRTGDEALAEVARLFATMSAAKRARHPEGSPQTRDQRAMVRAWATHDTAPAAAARESAAMGDAALSRRERVRGCLLGGAVGDALGWPVEFLSLASIRARFGPDGIRDLADAPGGVGAITDDTQMTLFTAEGLLRAGCARPRSGRADVAATVWRAYLRWHATQGEPRPRALASAPGDAPGWLSGVRALHARRAPGETCLAALSSGRMGTVADPINGSKGCGGVMRVAPAAVVCDDPFRAATELAAITHGHPSGYLSAGALALMVARVLDGASLEEAAHAALERLGQEARHDETSRALRGALDAWREGGAPSAERVERLGGGWTGEQALAIAVYCALAADGDFATGVRLAVNHTGDSDSTGSIAGQLLGALLGEGAIPRAWRDRVELREEILTIADDLATGYRDDDAWRERYPGC